MSIKNKLREMWNKYACKRGKHRWADGYNKTETETITYRFCQSCEAKESLDVRQRRNAEGD
jgi:hypothetical protein